MQFVSKNFDELTVYELYEILKVRSQIFILEQKMNCQDLDSEDYNARHFFLRDGQRVAAYLRVLYTKADKSEAKIGRVLSVTHNIGLGKRLMRLAIDELKNSDCKKIVLNSQKHASGFYQKLGFTAVSDEFLEEGVVHIKMELEL